jgi:hypothetical protein
MGVWDGPTHARDTAVPTMSLCGLGYAWPSTIALEREGRPADCAACLAILARRKELNPPC